MENDNMELTPEMLAKAKMSKSAEELLTLAKENDYALTEEEAKQYLDKWSKEGELSDEELENVVGGCGGYSWEEFYSLMLHQECPKCHRTSTTYTGTKKQNPVGSSYYRAVVMCDYCRLCFDSETYYVDD